MMAKLLLPLLVVYLIVLVLLYLFQDKMIFFPQPTHPQTLSRYADHEVHFNRDGISLTGWFFNRCTTQPCPVIVYYGGNAEDVSLNFPDLDRFPAGAFLFMNYRGFGKSAGKPTEKALLEDALFVLDRFLALEERDPKDVVLMGRSLGSGVAVHVAAHRPVGGVILVTPFDSLAAVAQSHYPLFPTRWLLRHRFESAALAPSISTPALFLMAENDRIVPKRFAERLKRSWGGPTTALTITGADHNSIETSTAYWDAVNRFLATQFAQKR